MKKIVQKTVSWILRFFHIKRSFNKKYLNVGCGSHIEKKFINVDYYWRPGIDLCIDLRKGIPLSYESLEGIFTEHTLEHISFEDSLFVLKEFYRLLKPKGNLRITVPDGGLYIDLYSRSINGEKIEFPYVGEEGQKDLEKDSIVGFTPMMAVNRIFRGYGHLFAYDYETLKNMLASIGFKDIKQESFGLGREKKLILDSEKRKPQTLYVEASK